MAKTIKRNYRIEEQALLSCVSSESAITAHDTPVDFDWAYMISTARWHGILPLVYTTFLSRFNNTIPAELRKRVDKYFYLNSCRNLYLTGVLLDLLQQLNSVNITAIPYKGPVLSDDVYGSLGFREFGDLDILIKPKDIHKAIDVLEQNGFCSALNLTGKQERAFLATNHAYNMVREEDKSVVELHWRFTPRYFRFNLERDSVWTRLTHTTLNGTEISVLSAEDLVLVLCGHGTKHCWDRLSYICDIANVIHAYPQMNWNDVIMRAKKFGGLRMLMVGVSAAHQLLSVDIPAQLQALIDKDSSVKSLTTKIADTLFESRTSSSPTVELIRIPFHLKAKERMKDKILYLFFFF